MPGWPRSIHAQAVAVLLLTLALGALSSFAVLRLNTKQDVAYARVERSRTLQLDLAAVSQAMLDQQTGLRDFVVTQDPQFLQPYEDGRNRLPALEARLRAEMPAAGNAELDRLYAAIAEWQAWAERRRAQAKGMTAEENATEAVTGKRLFDAIRSDEAAINDSLVMQLNANLARAHRRSNAEVVWIVSGSAAALVLLLALTAMLLIRTLRPLGILSRAAAGLAAGRGVHIPFKGRRDEVGALARALEQWRHGERERAELAATMAAVSEKVELSEALETAATRLLPIIGADEIVITLVSPEGAFTVATAQPKAFTPGKVLPPDSPGGLALREQRPVITNLQEHRWDPSIEAWRDEHEFGPVMAIPLRSGGKLHGVATVLRSRKAMDFTPSDLDRAILILPYVASAIHVSRLFGEAHASNLELEHASRMKSEFLANMSHELRTPLNSILGFSQLLLDNPAQAEDRKILTRYLGNINSSGRHLLGLINDILDLSKIEAGKFELTLERCDVAAVVAAAVGMVESLAGAKRIEVRSEALPGLEIVADAGRLKQVLINLLSNAIKFTPEEGRVSVAVEMTQGVVVIRVADTGVGIQPEDKDRIFEEFQQGESGRARGVQGTGLGLSLAKRFIEMHGGAISVESAVGVGSTFTIELPSRLQGERLLQRNGPADPAAPEVLVIEDDPAMGALIAEYLSKGGYRSVVVPSGSQGILLARELRPVAITLDILLPDHQDLSILRHLKEDPRTSTIPVLVVSVTDDRAAAIALGAADHLVKPVESAVLLQTINRHVKADAGSHPLVLVVDDDAAVRTLAGEALKSSGYRVVEAESGRRALELVRATHPNAVLLDLMMPDANGFDVIARLRADPATAHLPVIVVTARSLDPAERRYLEDAVSAIFSKTGSTATWPDLIACLDRSLGRRDVSSGALPASA